MGMDVSEEWAEHRLSADLAKFLHGTIMLCPLLAERPAALGAITDFSFNLGLGNLRASTLRKRLNEGMVEEARRELRRWVNGGGRRLPGLVLRREAEAALL